MLTSVHFRSENTTHFDSSRSPSNQENSRILSWGNNINGQLGLGHEQRTVSMPTFMELLQKQTVRKIDCSKEGTAILLQNGKLFTVGGAKGGSLGHNFGVSPRNENIPRQVEGLENEVIVDMSMADSHGAAINEKGELFVWGSYRHGKLGIEMEEVKVQGRRLRNSMSRHILKQPKKNFSFGTGTNQLQAVKVLCSNQNTFIISKSE